MPHSLSRQHPGCLGRAEGLLHHPHLGPVAWHQEAGLGSCWHRWMQGPCLPGGDSLLLGVASG